MAYLHKLVAGNDIVKLEDHWFEIYQSLLFENTSFKGFIAMFNDSFYQARKPLNSEILKKQKTFLLSYTCSGLVQQQVPRFRMFYSARAKQGFTKKCKQQFSYLNKRLLAGETAPMQWSQKLTCTF